MAKKKIKNYCDPGSSIEYKTSGWRTFKPVFDRKKCIKCGQCEQVCPEGVCFYNKAKDAYDVDLTYCKGCGLCAKICPAKAIHMEIEEK